jgi:hypothetical protein
MEYRISWEIALALSAFNKTLSTCLKELSVLKTQKNSAQMVLGTLHLPFANTITKTHSVGA